MTDEIKNYPGGKNGAGVFQNIISEIPEHKVYIELFAGGAAILRRKKPAEYSFAVEINPKVCARLEKVKFENSFEIINSDAVEFLNDKFSALVLSLILETGHSAEQFFIYADPPYLLETRQTQSKLYEYEFWTNDKHAELIAALKKCGVKFALSGYRSELYAEILPAKEFRTIDIPTTNRAGQRTIETVWFNYDAPERLHDFRFIGTTHRERQRIRKQWRRFRAKIKRLPPRERNALLQIAGELSKSYEK